MHDAWLCPDRFDQNNEAYQFNGVDSYLECQECLYEKGIEPTTESKPPVENYPLKTSNRQIYTSNVGSIVEGVKVKLKKSDVLKFQPEDFYEYIIKALENRPNQTCVFDRLPDYVLKHIGLRTSGEPRDKIVGTIKTALRYLENEGKVEFYKAKNKKVWLLKAGKYSFRKDS